jgi:AcrR family transcriptional regulator
LKQEEKIRRRRRDPADAQREILDAAELLFAAHGPDAVGLKEVARKAGVSHALVTHYFGSYRALVEASLARRLTKMREQAVSILAAAGPRPDAGRLIDALFALVNDPAHVRIVTWALLSGRGEATDSFVGRQRGLELVAGLITNQLVVQQDRDPAEVRQEVEGVLMVALSAAYGWAIGKTMFLASLGRAAHADEDQAFRDRVTAMLRGYLARSRG